MNIHIHFAEYENNFQHTLIQQVRGFLLEY